MSSQKIDDLLVLLTCQSVILVMLPIALRLILRGFPGTDGLMSPPKDTKVNFLFNFRGRAECTWKRNKSLRNKSLLQVGPEL